MLTELSQRFIFERTDIRGDLVQMEQSYQEMLAGHNYPDVVANLLGEFVVASVLLSSTIKFKGRLILQARSQGEIPLLMVESTSNREVRGIARLNGEISSHEFSSLFQQGSLVVTIEPEKSERYQSLVPLTGHNLASCLEHYFLQSEQLQTCITLMANGQEAAGLLLQQLPRQLVEDAHQREEQWQHVSILGQTIKDEELRGLSPEKILNRLYANDAIRLFAPEPVTFKCTCSAERTGRALIALGQEELESLLLESEPIVMNCEFCHREYKFDRDALAENVRGDNPAH